MCFGLNDVGYVTRSKTIKNRTLFLKKKGIDHEEEIPSMSLCLVSLVTSPEVVLDVL